MPGSNSRTDESDWRLFDAELRASLAYADALVAPEVITSAERDQLAAALRQITKERDAGALEGDDPDMFAVIGARLESLVGAAAGKLQSGRSRNEQIITALRMWLTDTMEELGDLIADIQRALLQQAEGHVGALMPGYIHFQPAQVISCSHWLLSYFWMLARDQERLVNSIGRTSISPLGSGLLAGTPYRLDRSALAGAIGLTDITQNSIDAVSDWDFAAEFLFVASLLGVHLSRLAEDLLLYSSPTLGFVSFTETPSAAMVSARGAAGRLFGQLAGYLGVLKGLPSVYNLDASENRSALYTVMDTLTKLLPEVAEAVESLTLQADRMWDAIDENILTADLADYLQARGVSQRESQAIVARVVRRAEQSGIALSDMALADFQAESPAFSADVSSIFDFSRSVGRHIAVGGTAPPAVRAQLRHANNWLVEAGFA